MPKLANFFQHLLTSILLLTTSSLAANPQEIPQFQKKISEFPSLETAKNLHSITDKITFRASEQPFLLIASLIFLLAILHTFFAVPITKMAHRAQQKHNQKLTEYPALLKLPQSQQPVCFKATALHFLGEIEAIFGIWATILLITMSLMLSFTDMKAYIANINFTEPLFVVVIMSLASTRPIIRFSESLLRFFARWGKESPAAWWLSIMIIAPILGSFITEPGAMTIAALLLSKKFYRLQPTPRFAYATLGLLFLNISIGGVLTNFAAPPVLMVAQKWNISSSNMFFHYGDKAIIAIILSTLLYYFYFRRELRHMSLQVPDLDGDGISDWTQRENPIPPLITLIHLACMAATVIFVHEPALFIGGFLFFLAFQKATRHHQNPLNLNGPILVGFFLAGLVIHGGLQAWWLQPILSSLTKWPMFFGSVLLTSFNDNAAITYLASQVDGLSHTLQYAVLAGAVTGGGLTVIANAPNPAGQALLSRFFGDGVSPIKLLTAALIPTTIAAICFMSSPPNIPEKKPTLIHPNTPPPKAILVTPNTDNMPLPIPNDQLPTSP